MNIKTAIEAFKQYVILQQSLCDVFGVNYTITDKDHLIDAPKSGAVVLSDEYWEFQKHGSGICFKSANRNTVVDVTKGVFTYPSFFDAWRLVEYFESVCVDTLSYKDTPYDASEPRDLERLLKCMEEDGVLKKHSFNPGHFSF